MYAKPIENLIKAFSSLPTVGPRTAERFVFHLLKKGKKDVGELTLALKELMDNIKSCEICWDFSDTSPCHFCSDARRDPKMICVVAQPQDRETIERTGEYHGQYHILRGTLKPDDDGIAQFLKLNELVNRIKKNEVDEIILALNPDINGETTMMYLERQIKNTAPETKVTRLARGLPMGSDLQYADEITLGSALKHRTQN
ncbi:MAG TPA: recombination protein RecR [Candidatus Magasanikbacteria bacterium]|nr:MAG: recombination protein RecR [Candidatus Magasanikbacteria bacterium RIFOXYC2_FULL_39_8]HAT03861.1 recombination protein RecR [Candidatus Magasanikbacteria bacterium]